MKRPTWIRLFMQFAAFMLAAMSLQSWGWISSVELTKSGAAFTTTPTGTTSGSNVLYSVQQGSTFTSPYMGMRWQFTLVHSGPSGTNLFRDAMDDHMVVGMTHKYYEDGDLIASGDQPGNRFVGVAIGKVNGCNGIVLEWKLEDSTTDFSSSCYTPASGHTTLQFDFMAFNDGCAQVDIYTAVGMYLTTLSGCKSSFASNWIGAAVAGLGGVSTDGYSMTLYTDDYLFMECKPLECPL